MSRESEASPTDPAARHAPDTALPVDSAAELAGTLDAYMADLQAGRSPDRGALLAAHPALADQLEACLAGIEFVHRVAGPAAGSPARLGDFQIVRELGRGGMGVVYEAEQTTLRRRVALKVLRYGAVADPEAMERFQREAETVARLHHINIVPIFAVGRELDVHYYAMQFIEGQSLADVQARSPRSGKPLASQDIAVWGLQAAEALTHAHQRGVIHRDIKPSNLLLDPEGVVWLTDFGLAKRAGEATLTVEGALLGTPQYMSPEQAESLERPVDHRTDLYSLGATLYELATGRPVFESATPHGIIARILNEQPTRPRLVRPDLPRDLETIILTCLAKDPADRYQTARTLADDLRAVLDGRPIQARRAPLRERMSRYVRRRRKSIGVGSIIVAATSLLIVGALLGWRAYREARLGRVLLATDGPALTAQVLAEPGGQPVGEPFAVGTRTVLSLPADSYRLRVGGPGILSQTYHFGVDPGELASHRLTTGQDRLLGNEPVSYSVSSDALVLSPGKSDLVEWTGMTLIRRDGASGKPVWDASRPAKPWDPKRDPVAWIQRLSIFGMEQQPGSLVRPASDLDGDGTADLVWAFRGTPSLLALSGKDGSMLWNYIAQSDGPGGPDAGGPAWPRSIEQAPRPGRLLGSPSARDIDGDGVIDLVAAFAVIDDVPTRVFPRGSEAQWNVAGSGAPKHRGRRVIVAVSGRSGRALWSYPIDRQATTLALDPSDGGTMLVDGAGGSTVAFVDGAHRIGIDPVNGKPRGRPIDLGFAPVRPIQHADLDGDGEAEILALGPGPTPGQQTLAAFSQGTGHRIWVQTIRAAYELPLIKPAANWPLIVDLDGDGRSEIVVADSSAMAMGDHYRGARMLDGVSGADRWIRPLHPKAPGVPPLATLADGLAQLIEAPDLDGDGTRDLIAVSRFDGRFQFEQLGIFVDALSGKDGRSLWWWHAEFKSGFFHNESPLIWPPFLWGRGANDEPMVAVPLGGAEATRAGEANLDPHRHPPRLHLLSVANGRELHAIEGLSWPRPADLDGNGLEDLWGSVDGKLRAYRGEAPEAWRVLGRFRKTGDLDGDGIADVVSDDLQIRPETDEESRKTLTAAAHSGRDGRMLWRTRLTYQGPWHEFHLGRPTRAPGYTLLTFALPGGDLDGDGAPEIGVIRNLGYSSSGDGAATLPLEVLSGRSGRPLWSAGPLPLGFDPPRSYSEIASIDLRTCEPRGPVDIIVRHHGQFVQPGSPPGGGVLAQDRLARLSGRDGHVIWDVSLADRLGDSKERSPDWPHEFGDFDGGGGLDLVTLLEISSPAGPYLERRAISLRDGKTLWSHGAPYRSDQLPILASGDLDGDGWPELVVREPIAGNPRVQFAVTVLDGRDGSTRWTWRGGFADEINRDPRDVCLADLDGNGRYNVCVNVRTSAQRQRLMILDQSGNERASRDVKAGSASSLTRADVDGDGRDELLLQDGDRLRAVRGDLEDLWNCPAHPAVREVIPAGRGRAAVVVLESMAGLDGSNGQPRWDGHGATAVLDPGNATHRPRLLAGSDDATVCRLGITTVPDRPYRRAGGAPIAQARRLDDPRWVRSLPWSGHYGPNLLWALLHLAGRAALNVVVPVAILKLATRRRVWGIRLLMAIPVVIAIPLAARLTIARAEPLAPWALTSAVGLPVLEYVAAIGQSIRHRRWQRLAIRFGFTALATAALATWWLWADMAGMLPMEHYSSSGWYLVVIPGAFIVGALACIVRIGVCVARRIRRLREAQRRERL